MDTQGPHHPATRAVLVTSGLLLAAAAAVNAAIEPVGAAGSSISFPPPAGVALSATPAVVHLGEPVLLSGPFCAEGLSVVRAATYLDEGYSRMEPGRSEIDPATLSIAQDAHGLTAIVSQARRGLRTTVSLECSDGTFATATFEAFPVGAWWSAGIPGLYGGMVFAGVVAPGQPIIVAGYTIDCAVGATASARLLSSGGAIIATGSGGVEAEGLHGRFVFQLATPVSAGVGPALVELSCPTATGTFVDSTGITISEGPPSGSGSTDLPPTGRGWVTLSWGALTLIAVGAAMSAVSKTSQARET